MPGGISGWVCGWFEGGGYIIIITQNVISIPKIHILQSLLCRLIINEAKRILTNGNPSQNLTSTTVYRG